MFAKVHIFLKTSNFFALKLHFNINYMKKSGNVSITLPHNFLVTESIT